MEVDPEVNARAHLFNQVFGNELVKLKLILITERYTNNCFVDCI
jgi:hypothetical protein